MQQFLCQVFKRQAPVAALALLSACANGPLAAPVGSPAPLSSASASVAILPSSPAPSPAATKSPLPGLYINDFSAVPVDKAPLDFVDVTQDGPTPDWVYRGDWHGAQDELGQPVLLQDQIRPETGVSFLRYTGDALGLPGGKMPPSYYAEVVVRPLESPFNYPPTGDQGTPFYYLSPTTYLEVVIKPTLLEIWEANGAAPHTTQGWHRLWYEELQTNAGDKRRVGALIDVPTGTFTAYLDGKAQGQVQSALLKPQEAYVALRAIGNKVSFSNFRIEAR
jgi:hypothetical protein